jgi:hypothetical protein
LRSGSRCEDIKTGCDGVDGINLAQDMDQWPALVDKIINCQIVQKAGNISMSQATLRLTWTPAHGINCPNILRYRPSKIMMCATIGNIFPVEFPTCDLPNTGINQSTAILVILAVCPRYTDIGFGINSAYIVMWPFYWLLHEKFI